MYLVDWRWSQSAGAAATKGHDVLEGEWSTTKVPANPVPRGRVYTWSADGHLQRGPHRAGNAEKGGSRLSFSSHEDASPIVGEATLETSSKPNRLPKARIQAPSH